MWQEGVIYDEWVGGNCGDGWGPIGNNTASCYGMRFPTTMKNGAKHGIVRTEWYNGTVEEGTWYSGNEGDPATKWGLTRLIDDGRVFIQFFKDGALHFQSTFDRNFVELDRMYEEEFRDEYFMQDIAPFKFSKEPISSKDMLDLVLNSRPVHLGSIQDAMWSRFIDIDVTWFEKWWELPGEEMITWDEVVYDEWTSADTIVEGSHEVIVRNYGTRSKAEGAIKHAGLVRQVAFNDFRQLTYTMEGQKNGISIGVAAANIPEIG